MSDQPSERHQIENEKILRHHNIKSKQAVKQFLSAAKNAEDLPVEFACECSDSACETHVTLSITNYEKAHLRRDRFVVAKGHERPNIEKVIKTDGDIMIVEKYALSP